MSFTRSLTNTTAHQDMPDYPSAEGYTAAQLKSAFDAPAQGLQTDINRVLDELEAATASADLGADELYEGDDTGGNVQAKLVHLYQKIQEAVMGNIPDGTITKAKLATSFANTIPTNVEMGKLYLASQYRTPTITTETPASYSIPKMTSSSHTGYNAAGNATMSSGISYYDFFKNDGSGRYTMSDANDARKYITFELPKYAKITSIKLKWRCKIYVYGSIDNTNWTLIDTFDGANTEDNERTHTVTDRGYYKYIKFEGLGSTNYSARIYNNAQVSGVSIDSLDNNTMAIAAVEDNELLTAYATGQIVKVWTPSNYIQSTTINSTLNIYGLGAKAIPKDLAPSTRYSLVYDGTKFVLE